MELRRGCLAGPRAGICLEKEANAEFRSNYGILWIIQRREGFGAVGFGFPPTNVGGAAARAGLSRAAFLKAYALDGRGGSHILGDGVLKAVENFVGGVLQTSVGLVQLPRRLGSQLTELVAVGDVSESSKNEI